MDSNFSTELKQLVAKSRSIAIELGYNYISTLHFYIADCERDLPSSLRLGLCLHKPLLINLC